MATVPTLTVGSTDQTDFIQHKTLGFRLRTLDFTLVDPATTPALHDAVSLDEPDWHGRVSTVESFPFHTAGGDDHRLVKVTATNKLVAPSDTAPFGLSDTPDLATTFPYRDLVVIRTLADQTDLATAELRIHATIYEPGIVPGMTVDVTNAAESLSAEPVIVTEMTVSWLRDDSPEFRLESSDTGVPPVTLGGLIGDAGCDCGVYECVPPDYGLVTEGGQLACIINDTITPFHDRDCRSDVQGPSTQPDVMLYAGSTYRVRYSVYHSDDAWDLTAGLIPYTGGGTLFAFHAGGDGYSLGTTGHPPIPLSDWITETIPTTNSYVLLLDDIDQPGRNAVGSSAFTVIEYISGPDPRFEDLPPCADEPLSGQRVEDPAFEGDGTTTDFTTGHPYGAGSLEVFVNGLDWTAVLTETDPAAGDYGTAYPYPTGATVSVRYRGA